MKTIKQLHLTIYLYAILSFPVSAQPTESWSAPIGTVNSLSKNQPGVNYSEDKVPFYTLPDPLSTNNGKKVRNQKEWSGQRRSEILGLFRENVYGRVPATPYTRSFRLVKEDKHAMGGKATLKEIDITITAGERSLDIHLVLFVPNDTQKPVPAFLLINNRGPENTDPLRKIKSEFWPAEEVVARGYAIAAFRNADVDPDNFDDFRNGIHGILDRERQPDSWGTLAAWAWGASRCMDYFESDQDIDSRRVAVVGHSRGGKTALWAGAEDQRFALVISNESGCGGAALARRKYGETVAMISTSFPHWFCTNYNKWANNEEKMPVDMHMLLGLIAPRALYVSCADQDLWGDPRGSYLALQNALPVFRLFDNKTNIPELMPPLNRPVSGGQVGFHIREGNHSLLLQDWNWFMNFADTVLKN